MLADDFERQIGLRREGKKLVDPRPENPYRSVGGELTPHALLLAAEGRAKQALEDYRKAGASRIQVWRVALNVLNTEAPDTTEETR